MFVCLRVRDREHFLFYIKCEIKSEFFQTTTLMRWYQMLHFSPPGVLFSSRALCKISVAAALTKPDPLKAEECTNRIFVQLDKDNKGKSLSPL